MSFISESEHLLVTSAVTKCLDVILRAVERQGSGAVGIDGSCGQCLADAMHLLFAIAVVGLETPRNLAINHFYLGAQYRDVGYPTMVEEGTYPIVDAGTYDENLCAFR